MVPKRKNGLRRRVTVALAVGAFAIFVPAAQASRSATPTQVQAPTGADFNGDGWGDLAVGSPTDLANSQGSVTVFYGSTNGITKIDVEFITQDKLGVPETGEQDDEFGWAVAWGNFDGDRFSDLAVGMPGETLGSAQSAGGVVVLYGSKKGLLPVKAKKAQFWSQNDLCCTTSEPDDAMGYSLAAGDFNQDGADDLAVGAPGETVQGGVVGAGYVSVIYGVTGVGLGAAGNAGFSQDTPGMCCSVAETDDAFGSSLVAADFGLRSPTDLAVGVPHEGVESGAEGAGAVAVLYGSPDNGLEVAGNQLFTQDTPGMCCSVSEPDDQFGFSLAAGNFGKTAQADLAIGVPQEDVDPGVSNGGGVNVLYGSDAGLTVAGNQMFTQNTTGMCCSTAEENDYFGYALAAGDFGMRAKGVDLAIGVENEGLGNDDPSVAGAAQILYGTPSGLNVAGNQLWTQDTGNVKDAAEFQDSFGASLTATNLGFSEHSDLAVGVPWEDIDQASDAGAVNILFGSPGGLTDANNQFLTQGDPGSGDFFSWSIA
jgi:hypothetical protein